MGIIPRWTVALIAALVVLGRLDLGEHYPGDVLGGIVVGLIILCVVAWLWPRLVRFFAQQPWPRPLIIGGIVAALAVLGTPLTPPGRWQLLGILTGVVVGLPLEAHGVGFDALAEDWRDWLQRLAIGVAGLLPLALIAMLLRHAAIVAQWLVPCLAALWIVLGVPAALQRRRAWRARSLTLPGGSGQLRNTMRR
jgi:hypothetical protein